MVIGRSELSFPLLDTVSPPPLGEFLPSLCERSLPLTGWACDQWANRTLSPGSSPLGQNDEMREGETWASLHEQPSMDNPNKQVLLWGPPTPPKKPAPVISGSALQPSFHSVSSLVAFPQTSLWFTSARVPVLSLEAAHRYALWSVCSRYIRRKSKAIHSRTSTFLFTPYLSHGFLRQLHPVISPYPFHIVRKMPYLLRSWFSNHHVWIYTQQRSSLCSKTIVGVEFEGVASVAVSPRTQDLFPYLLWWFQYWGRGEGGGCCKSKRLRLHFKQNKTEADSTNRPSLRDCQWNECARVKPEVFILVLFSFKPFEA